MLVIPIVKRHADLKRTKVTIGIIIIIIICQMDTSRD